MEILSISFKCSVIDVNIASLKTSAPACTPFICSLSYCYDLSSSAKKITYHNNPPQEAVTATLKDFETAHLKTGLKLNIPFLQTGTEHIYFKVLNAAKNSLGFP